MRPALAIVAILAGVGVVAGIAAAGVVGGLIASVEAPAADPPAPRASEGPGAQAQRSGGQTSAPTASPGGAVAGPLGELSSPSSPTPETTRAVLTLTGPTTAPAGGRLDLTGHYEGASQGTVLQVQRRVAGGDWADFPVQVPTGANGQFSTRIVTSRTGPQQFRVVDPVTGLASPPVDVTISSSPSP